MTLIIGARCSEGDVMVADTRILRGFEAFNRSKIHVLWEKVVTAGSGATSLIDKFSEEVKNLEHPERFEYEEAARIVEDVVYRLKQRYEKRLGKNYDIAALVMALDGLDKGKPSMRVVFEEGDSEDVEEYRVIGHGSPYATSIFALLYDNSLRLIELSVLGFFVVSLIAALGVDQSVGVGPLGPDVVVLRRDERPKFLDTRTKEFARARESLKNLNFRYKLVSSVWSKTPEVYANVDRALL